MGASHRWQDCGYAPRILSGWLEGLFLLPARRRALYLVQRLDPATKKPIGDMAWDFFNSRPESKKVQKPDFHFYAGLIKGIADNYKSFGENWPDSRYIVIGLYGELEPTEKHHQLAVVRGWQCRYDLATGKFDVPDNFAKANVEALRKDKQSLR